MSRSRRSPCLIAAAALAALACAGAGATETHAPSSHDAAAPAPASPKPAGHAAPADSHATDAPAPTSEAAAPAAVDPAPPGHGTLADHLRALKRLDQIEMGLIPAPEPDAHQPAGHGPDTAPGSAHDAAAPADAAGHGAPAEPAAHAPESGHDAAQSDQPADAQQPAADAHGATGHEPATAHDAAGVQAPSDLPATPGGEGDSLEKLDPYKLVRSMQFVQDAVVQGDHSSMEMQRYLLGVIDARLRQADQTVFDDPRNVDAALIYAMSGGNPATLDILAVGDKFGNFDNDITLVLRAYLNGRVARTKTPLADLVKLYRGTTIGPYLSLVAANVLAGSNDPACLDMFDWARLTSPGTLVEEAALRRSLAVAAQLGQVDRAIKYAELYARRFIHSPYAGQYADQLVDLVIENYGKVGDEKLDAVVSFMDQARKREIYLRVSRKAVIRGMLDLASFAAGRADALADAADPGPAAMAELYSSMAKVPTGSVSDAMAALNAVPEQQLSPRDKALRAMAQQIASDVLSKPDPASLTQATAPTMQSDTSTIPDAVPVADGTASGNAEAAPAAADGAAGTQPSESDIAADKVFRGYVSQHQQALDEIDKLLKTGTGAAGT